MFLNMTLRCFQVHLTLVQKKKFKIILVFKIFDFSKTFDLIFLGSEFQIEHLESEKTVSLNQKLNEANQPLDKLYFLSKK